MGRQRRIRWHLPKGPSNILWVWGCSSVKFNNTWQDKMPRGDVWLFVKWSFQALSSEEGNHCGRCCGHLRPTGCQDWMCSWEWASSHHSAERWRVWGSDRNMASYSVDSLLVFLSVAVLCTLLVLSFLAFTDHFLLFSLKWIGCCPFYRSDRVRRRLSTHTQG